LIAKIIWERKKWNSLAKRIDRSYANYGLMFDELSKYFLLGFDAFHE
jgi:hypothetical protein